MLNNLVRKGLVIAVIVMLVGLSVIPTINAEIIKSNQFSRNIKVDSSLHYLLTRKLSYERLDDSKFDRMIEFVMKLGHMPSLSACIVRKDTVVWAEGYGDASVNKNRDATEHTVYQIASVSKSITATVVMQLVEQKLIDLDADVNRYLPFSLRNPKYPEDNITVRMLLAQQSSINDEAIGMKLFFYFSMLSYPNEWLKEYLIPGGIIYNPRVWSQTRPGEGFHYNSLNFELLGYLVKLVTGQFFEEYCKIHIFEQLDMNHTSFNLIDYRPDELAIPSVYLLGRCIPLPIFENRNYAAGGVRTSVVDLSHFLIAHMNGGMYNGTRILDPENISLMHSLYYPNTSTYGLGWMNWYSEYDDEWYGGHIGSMIGVRAVMWMRYSDNVGIIFFWNQNIPMFYRRPYKMISEFLIERLLLHKATVLPEK